MAQKIGATSLRLGNTQLWKFETNPTCYTNSNAGYIFVYFFLKQELKKINYFIVDARKTEQFGKSRLNLVLFIPPKAQTQKRRARVKRIKAANLFLNKPLKRKKKRNKKKLRLFKKLSKTVLLSRKELKNWTNLKTLKAKTGLAYSSLGHSGGATSYNFQLKQKPLKRKIQFQPYRSLKTSRAFLVKKSSKSRSKFGTFLKLKKLGFLLELKIKKHFNVVYSINLKNVYSRLSYKTKRSLIKIKRKLQRSARRISYFNELLDAISISFDFKSADFLSEYISRKISSEKKITNFIKFLTTGLKTTFDIKKTLSALKVEIWGKRFKSSRTKKTRLVCGALKLSTIKLPAYESTAHAFTRFGTFGIRTVLIKK